MSTPKLIAVPDSAHANLAELPEEIEKVGHEAISLVWQFARQKIDQLRIEHQQALEARDAAFSEYRHDCEHKLEALKQESQALSIQEEQVQRKVAGLQRELRDRELQLATQREHDEKNQQELLEKNQEIRQLVEQRGRLNESVDRLQKQLEQSEQECRNQDGVRQEIQLEATLHAKERERLDNRLKEALQEQDRLREKLKKEQTQLAAAHSQVEELRSSLQRVRDEMDFLHREGQERQDLIAAEMKSRVEAEKKAAALEAKLYTVEKTAKESHSRLDQELNKVRAEGLVLRDRMIKAEGEAERQKRQNEIQETKWLKVIERMEAKLQQMESKLQSAGAFKR